MNKRNKEELNEAKQFTLLEAFLDWKGEEFKKRLIIEYIKSFKALGENEGRRYITPLPYEITDGILDLFNVDEVFYFIKNIYKFKSLSNLKEEFDEKIIADGLGTREQTYLKDEYLELLALSQILKTIIGPIGQFANDNIMELNAKNIHHSLSGFFLDHPISESRPFIKLQGLINKIMETLSRNKEESDIRTIETGIAKEDIPTAALATAIIQKVAMAVVMDDNESKNIITRTYNFINNKLQNKGDTSTAIRAKMGSVDMDSGDGDAESKIEQFRIVSNLPHGSVVELNWSAKREIIAINKRYNFYNKEDELIYKDTLVFTDILRTSRLNPTQPILLGWIFKDIIDPRSIEYILIDGIVNLLATGFVYLWKNGFKDLAILLTSKSVNNIDSLEFNATTNIARIPKEIKSELDIYYPFKKVIISKTGNKEVNLAEESISLVTELLFKYEWSYTAYSNYILEVNKNVSDKVVVPSNIKIRLAELILHLNKR